MGLGSTVAFLGDVVFAARSATFADTHVRMGIAAGDGGQVIWPLLMGVNRAKYYLMTGDRISAEEAERLGLVNFVVDDDALMERDELLRVGRAIGQLNRILPKRQFILMGPGRWGSRGDIKLGVSVTYSDISNTAVLLEVARKKGKYVPELSFGTHFFQDLVEAGIRYLPLYPDDSGIEFNEAFLTRSSNIFTDLVPEFASLSEIIRVIDVPKETGGRVLRVLMNADLVGANLTHIFQKPILIQLGRLFGEAVEDLHKRGIGRNIAGHLIALGVSALHPGKILQNLPAELVDQAGLTNSSFSGQEDNLALLLVEGIAPEGI